MALRAQQIAAAEIGGGVVGIGGDRGVEIGERGTVLVDLAIGQRAIGVGAGEIRIELDRLGEIVDRVLELPDLGVGDAARVVGGGSLGLRWMTSVSEAILPFAAPVESASTSATLASARRASPIVSPQPASAPATQHGRIAAPRKFEAPTIFICTSRRRIRARCLEAWRPSAKV